MPLKRQELRTGVHNGGCKSQRLPLGPALRPAAGLWGGRKAGPGGGAQGHLVHLSGIPRPHALTLVRGLAHRLACSPDATPFSSPSSESTSGGPSLLFCTLSWLLGFSLLIHIPEVGPVCLPLKGPGTADTQRIFAERRNTVPGSPSWHQ